MNTELAENIYHAALKILLGRYAKAFFLAPEPVKNADNCQDGLAFTAGGYSCD